MGAICTNCVRTVLQVELSLIVTENGVCRKSRMQKNEEGERREDKESRVFAEKAKARGGNVKKTDRSVNWRLIKVSADADKNGWSKNATEAVVSVSPSTTEEGEIAKVKVCDVFRANSDDTGRMLQGTWEQQVESQKAVWSDVMKNKSR
jgi:hypothetical protein